MPINCSIYNSYNKHLITIAPMATINKYLFLILCFLSVQGNLKAQENTDSIVLRYLRSKPDIPTPFLKVEKKGPRKGLISQNYFTDANTPIKIDSVLISTFLFGSSSTHSRKYFLLRMKSSHVNTYKIIDDDTFEAGLNDLLEYVRPYRLPDPQKAFLVNQLSYTYY
jgi:hypothetical protein